MSGTSPTVESLDTAAEVGTDGVDQRPSELRMARLHLRTGSYALARAELETLAGAGALDDEALLDLAEVRWRTDDLTGAGEAAAASIASGRIALIALVVAAEATAALGRPGEARRLAGRALEMVDGAIDPVFAGMPRSDVWPARWVERVVPGGVSATPSPVATTGPAIAAAVSPSVQADGHMATPAAPVVAVIPAAAAVAVPMAVAIDPGREGGEAMPDPQEQLAAARAALAVGDRAGAAIQLSIVLRLAPSLAPAVLDLAAAEPGPEFDLVRGDALRLVGRESQARRAFASAASRQPVSADAGSGSGRTSEDGTMAAEDVVTEAVVADPSAEPTSPSPEPEP